MLPLIASIGCNMGDGDCDKGNSIYLLQSSFIVVLINQSIYLSLLSQGHYRMLVIGSVLLDSGAMALPVSSFPNAQTFSFEVLISYLSLVVLLKTAQSTTINGPYE